MTNVYLCGFMGCGKSTVGKILAEELGCLFFDLDFYITEQEKATIPEIFSKYGEEYFREREAFYLKQLSQKNAVIALGGGAVINPVTASVAKKTGRTVFIDVEFEECYKRIKNDKNRPIVQSKTKEQLSELFEYRHDIYQDAADITIDAAGDAATIAREIAELIK